LHAREGTRSVKLYDVKTALTAADLLNDRVLPFYEEHGIPLSRVLTDRGSEYCGNPERHEYELYLAIENIDHSRTKTKSPQTNGICERFHKTMLDEFYRIAFRKCPSGDAQRQALSQPGRAAGRSGPVAAPVQRGSHPSRAMVLRKNADADLP
jgi:transposase InsO family protein